MGPCTRRTRSTVTKSRKVDTFKTKKKQNTHQFQNKISPTKTPKTKKSRNCLKKNQDESKPEAEVEEILNTTPPSSPVKGCNASTNDTLGDINTTPFCCLTPKSEKFRIPEITTCPPAPKKQRHIRSGCSALKRTPVSFYATPELELFFLFGLPKI